jgi:carbon monoxide dehydrogenase subunit G
MSSLKIEERFSVHAPVERVWRFLLDPEQIAPCLPGAELLQVENERTFHGQMKVKVGPVTVAYQGTIELTEVDETGRRVQMLGKGKEKGGAGSAKMTMESRLEPQDDGTVAISVTSDVELAGRIVRFGRGMIQSVSAQLFKQFAGNVRQALEGAGASADTGTDTTPDTRTATDAAAGSAGEPAVVAPAAAAEPETVTPDAAGARAAAAEPAVGTAPDQAITESTADQAVETAPAAAPVAPAAPASPAAPAPPASPAAPVAPASPAAPAAPASPAAPAAPARASDARPGRELVPRAAEPVRVLPLLFRAFWDVISGFFKRLLGRKT